MGRSGLRAASVGMHSIALPYHRWLYLTAAPACLLAVVGVAHALPPTPITACGVTVSGDATLVGDLDCSSEADVPVTLDSGRLDLAGYTLTSGTSGSAIVCNGPCAIFSSAPGGTVSGGGIRAFATVLVRDVTVADSPFEGVFASQRANVIDSFVLRSGLAGVSADTIRLQGSEIRDGLDDGAEASTFGRVRLRVKDSTIAGNGGRGIDVFGSEKQAATIKRSEISGNGDIGVRAGASGSGRGKVRLIDTIVSGNALFGVGSRNVTIKGGEVSNNGDSGVNGEFRKAGVIKDAVITGNGRHGIASQGFCDPDDPKPSRVKLKGTTTSSGNGTAVDCGVTETCADIAACAEPKLAPTVSCETSYVLESGFPGASWGLCALD